MGNEILATIIGNKPIAKDIYEMVLQTEAGLDFIPGQFANVGVPNDALLLKRPFSISAYNNLSGRMAFIYKTVGKGTAALSRMKAGETTELLAPLGKGFVLRDDYKTVFIVGGGIGCAPFLSVMAAYPTCEYHTFFGFDTKMRIYHKKIFTARSKAICFATEDGTYGEKGFVTAPLKKALESTRPDVLLACGPTPMLSAIKTLLKDADFPAFVSVEERMGCGMGGCAVCACKTTSGYKKACVHGPVFALSEVIFD